MRQRSPLAPKRAIAVAVLALIAACTEPAPEGSTPPQSASASTPRAAPAKPPGTRPLPPCAPATTIPQEMMSPSPYPVWKEPSPSPFEEPTERAELVEPVLANYPPLAADARVSGLVILEVVVSSEGVPLGARVLKGLPCGLEGEAKKAVKNAKFRPARRGDRPIDSLLTISVPFPPPARRP